MQKVTPKPYAPPKTGGTGKSIRLFSLRFHFISNRHALPETGTGVTQKPAYSVFDSILLNIVRNICPLVKRKTLPAEHFVQKNKNWDEPSQAHCVRQLPRGGSFLHLPVSVNKAPPFGGAGTPSGVTERVHFPTQKGCPGERSSPFGL